MDITIVRPIIKWKFNQLHNVVNNSTIDTGMTTCISIYNLQTNNSQLNPKSEWLFIFCLLLFFQMVSYYMYVT
jgi:hypothetical protein